MVMPNTAPYFLRSKRLGFRVWTSQDFDLALGLWGDPRVTRLIDARGHLDQDQVRDRLAREMATAESHGVQYWPIFLLENDAHVGCCGLRPYQPATQASAGTREIGFHLRPQYWRQGLAAEAALAVLDHAFNRLGAASVFAGHHPENAASRRLLTKIGFTYTHHEFYPPTGLDHPSYLLTAEEYGKSGHSG